MSLRYVCGRFMGVSPKWSRGSEIFLRFGVLVLGAELLSAEFHRRRSGAEPESNVCGGRQEKERRCQAR